jgi:integrase
MEWSSLDLQRGTAIIPAAKGYPEREAALTAEMVVLLANLDKTGRVFGYEQRWSVYKPWKAACAKAGIPYVSPHSAGRRAFATAMRAAKVDPKTAARRGGWASIRLMLDVYAGEDESADLIEAVFGTFESHPTIKKCLQVQNQKAKSKG